MIGLFARHLYDKGPEILPSNASPAEQIVSQWDYPQVCAIASHGTIPFQGWWFLETLIDQTTPWPGLPILPAVKSPHLGTHPNLAFVLFFYKTPKFLSAPPRQDLETPSFLPSMTMLIKPLCCPAPLLAFQTGILEWVGEPGLLKPLDLKPWRQDQCPTQHLWRSHIIDPT